MMKKEQKEKFYKPILVYYISVLNVAENDIEEYINKVTNRIILPLINAEALIIPVFSETRIECINPIYITDSDLIKKHERLMAELHEKLDYQINILNVNKNE